MKKTELEKKIVIERIKSMSQNVQIALGSKSEFLNKTKLIQEIKNDTETGKKIMQIQLRYLRALKEGII